MTESAINQADMVHRLPPAAVVDRVGYLTARARDRHVVHVGFVDSGCTEFHAQHDAWLHGHLAAVTDELIGLDVDADGVAAAVASGYLVYVVDCRDAVAVAALDLPSADVVIAGEIIEHLDDPGGLLDGLHAIVGPSSELVLTTPNAHGLLNALAAAAASHEVNHPDHVVLFSAFTLTNLLARHGWETVEVRTYVPVVKQLKGMRARVAMLGLGARVVLAVERLLGRLGRPYAADGLIVVARPRRGAPSSPG